LARQQHETVHAHGIYDIDVDSDNNDPLECAQQIKQAMENELSGKAFKILKQKLV
jgi:chloramphenicol 3-O phosphotransferase